MNHQKNRISHSLQCLILLFLLLFNPACHPNSINYNSHIIQIRKDYNPLLQQAGWKEEVKKEKASLFYYNDTYKGYLSISIDQVACKEKDINWQELTNSLINQIAKSSKLKILIKESHWETINKNHLLQIEGLGKRVKTPDFRLRIYWLIEDNILYKFICIGPEYSWPKILFDFVGLVNYFTVDVR